jgi:transcription initiation factor TFIIIB Brf1 subunit/transcription initiation factor TFIIB
MEEILDILDSLEKQENSEEKKKKNIEECSLCKSKNLYSDRNEGKIVCLECGLTLGDILDLNPDWNSINSTSDSNSRCGCPTNYFFPQSSLGTKVSYGNNRLSTLEKWSQMPYKERSRYDVLKNLEDKCKKSNISQPVIDNAKNIFNQLSKKKVIDKKSGKEKAIIIRGLNRESIISSCLYYGSNLQGEPRTTKEVAEVFGISETNVTKGNRKFRELMIGDKIIKNIRLSEAEDYIGRKEYIEKLKLREKEILISKKIAKNLKRLNLATDHQPASIAAGSIMLMANILNLNLNKKIISSTFKISEVTIMKTFNKIKVYARVLISDKDTEKLIERAEDKKLELINSETSEELDSINKSDYESSETNLSEEFDSKLKVHKI